MQTAFASVVPLFIDFDPQTRPVLWRILIAQVYLYEMILLHGRSRGTSTMDAVVSLDAISFDAGYLDGFRWFPADGREPSNVAAQRILEPFRAAHDYLEDRMQKNFTLSRRADGKVASGAQTSGLASIEELQKKIECAKRDGRGGLTVDRQGE